MALECRAIYILLGNKKVPLLKVSFCEHPAVFLVAYAVKMQFKDIFTFLLPLQIVHLCLHIDMTDCHDLRAG